MENLTSSEVYNTVHDFIYNRTELTIWVAFAFLLFLFFIVSSVDLLRFLLTVLAFAAVVAIGLYYLGYFHPNF